ncbi:TPA: chitobiase/beta-hexosaminidase C-terminal domain-containing protein [Bacillus pseudomycoides]|nr:chitobiase/beta-hexosaminidase C-terminal domain-containing protein [Bacillus pseudomycoides]
MSLKKLAIILFSLVFVVLTADIVVKAEQEKVLTVDEAIQLFQQQGKKPAVVEGYIVGFTQNPGKYTKDPTKFGDTNVAIAASPDEVNADKIMPVQLPIGDIRKAVNVKDHPENMGKKVRLTGTLDSYFSSPGLKSITNYAFQDKDNQKVSDVIASPNGGEVEKGTAVTLSTVTEGATIYYTLDGSNPTSQSIRYSEQIILNENSVMKAIAVKEGFENSATSTFAYTMVKNEPTRIHDIQGKSHISPYKGKEVKAVTGIVTQVDKSGFYIQDPQPDDDPATSEGIYVYKKDGGAKVGDLVSVDGLVEEFIGQGYADRFDTDLSITEIKAKSLIVKESNQPLPKAVVLGENGVKIPDTIIDNDGFGIFDPAEDAIDFYESLEGMLVTVPQPKVIGPQKNGNLYVTTANGSQKVTTKFGTPLLQADNANPERLSIKVARNYVAKAGDQLLGDITGIVGYDYGNYRISPIGELPALQDGGFKQLGANIQPRLDKLTVATYNIENFSANKKDTSDEKVRRLAYAIKYNLKMPDIIGVEEMQDNNGAINDGTTDAKLSAQRLINAIQEIRGPKYEYVEIAPENNKDGGAPGANIRVGFFYNPSRVKLAQKPVLLEKNVVRIGENNTLFDDTRKPLAAEFTFQGQNIVVIANHLNSKLGDASPFGKIQPLVLKSEAKRVQLAEEVNGFVKGIQERHANAPVVVVGDMNDFEFSKPMQALKGNIMKEMLETVPQENRYTYIHDGNAQVLDHIFVTNNIAPHTIVDPVHLNSNIMDENGRMSDHDPVLAQIDLKKAS